MKQPSGAVPGFGLIPKAPTGNRTILGLITKCGNRYLRMLLTQAARVVLLRSKKGLKHSFNPWLAAAAQRMRHNVLVTALADKLTRVAWSVFTQDCTYEARASACTEAA